MVDFPIVDKRMATTMSSTFSRPIIVLLPLLTVLLMTPSTSSTSTSKNVTKIPMIESSLTFIKQQAFEPHHYFCRINGICRVGDGTVMLPGWMKVHSEHIARCGLKNISYTLDEYLNDEDQDTWYARRDGLTLRDDFRSTDVLGGETPSAEREALATHLTPYLHTVDLFQRPTAYTNEISAVCIKQGGTACKSINMTNPKTSLHPLLLVDSRISNTKDFQWPKSLLRLFRTSMNGLFQVQDQREIYGWKVRTQASCFRSVLTTNVQTHDMTKAKTNLHARNQFFVKNNLKRTTAKRPSTAFAHCNIKMLILNRYGKRFIEGTSTLSSAISLYSQYVKQQASHIEIQPEVVYFENSSFHEQVSVIQEADVIIATHGENNANFMFLRPQTQVFELLPFAFQNDIYKNLTEAYDAVYTPIISQPDKQVFTACVRHFNPQQSHRRENFLQEWQNQADKFKNETIASHRNMASTYAVPSSFQNSNGDDDEAPLKNLRECAGYQRISVDIKHLARTAVQAATKQCPIDREVNLPPS